MAEDEQGQDEPEVEEADKAETQEAAPKPRRGLKAVWAWVRAKRSRTIGAAVGLVLVLGGVAVGATDLRYPVLGLFVKTSVEVTVTDAITKQGVPKASVDLGGASDVTDKNGHVTLKRVKPGHGQVTVRKTGYKGLKQAALAPLRAGAAVRVALEPNGIRVAVTTTNLITGGNVQGVEVKSGEASAISDSEGRAELSLPVSTNNTKQKLKLNRDGYNELELEVQVRSGSEPVKAKLTPAGKVYFQSNRSGRIDIYSANLDGSGTEVVLPATGSEDEATGILPNINDPHSLAIVSSRDGRRGGGLHHDLFLFNTESRKLTKIDQDIDFQSYRAWLGSTLVYVKLTYGVDGCSEIKTYDVTSGKGGTLVAGTYHGAGCPRVMLALSDRILYSMLNAGNPSQAGVFVAKLSGAPKRISATESHNVVQRAKQTLLSEYYNYSANPPEVWDSIDLGSLAVTRLPNGPSIEKGRFYNDSPDDSRSAFIEERDGKSELYVTDGSGGSEKKLTSMGSVNQFVQWYGSDYLVFSSTKSDENALYVVAATGGSPVKIGDFYRGNGRTYGGGGNPYN